MRAEVRGGLEGGVGEGAEVGGEGGEDFSGEVLGTLKRPMLAIGRDGGKRACGWSEESEVVRL